MTPFLIVILILLLGPSVSQGAEKKAKKVPSPAPKSVSSPVSDSGINNATVQDYFKNAQEQLKKGKVDDALRAFQAVYLYTRDVLAILKTVEANYKKVGDDPAIPQNQKEEVYIKLQTIGELQPRYTALKGESAYNIGSIYAKKGDAELARKYLLEACQSAPFSLNPASTWMKSKNLLLGLFRLEGEF